jgi:exosortase A
MNVLSGADRAAPPADAVSAASPPTDWRPTLIALALGTLAWLALFHAEAAHAIHVWETNTAYNHGWLILPVALYLFWVRRARLAVLIPAPTPVFALLALPIGLAWLVAERMGIMEGRQLTAVALLLVLVLAVVGWRVAKAFAAPLSYLFFLVPFGAFTVPALQTLTAQMIDVMLDFTGIPHYVDDLLIEIPAGSFYVAEACAGLRFLIAAIAFGALYAFEMFRSPGRRIIVMILAVTVPIIANGFRAFGLVMLGHWWGSAAAVEADHVLYGFVFFSIVIVLLILAGLPFREDTRSLTMPEPSPPPSGRVPAWAAAAAVLAVTATPAGAVALLDRAAGAPESVPVALVPAAGCVALPDGALDCGGIRFAARLLVFAPRVNWDAVAETRFRLAGAHSDQDVTFSVPIAGGGAWRARQPKREQGGVAVAAWLDGRAVGDGVRTRATQALRMLESGANRPPVIAVVEFRASGAEDLTRERSLLREILPLQGDGLAAEAARRSLGR